MTTEFSVGDITISQTPYNHGWTATREWALFLNVCTLRWENSLLTPPQDVMRYFAYLHDALAKAKADCEMRGVEPRLS